MERERGVVIVALPSVVEAVRAAIAQHGSLHAAAASAPNAHSFTGRSRAFVMTAGGIECVVRHYQRGGAAGRLLDDEFLNIGEPRPLRELRASAAARTRGVSTPEVVATVTYRAGAGAYYRADIATRLVPRAIDLAELSLGGSADVRVRCAGWTAAGALLRQMFAAGLRHADLNLRNMLITGTAEGSAAATLLDLDRAVVGDRAVSDVAGRRMLERLHRSRRKLESVYGERVTAAELAAFAAALAGVDA